MRRVLVSISVLFLFITPSVSAECIQCQDDSKIGNIEYEDITEKDNILSTTVSLTMTDDKVFIIPLTFNKRTLTAKLELASGKTVIATPLELKIIDAEPLQEFDDIDNTTDFVNTYTSFECYLFIILCITTGFSGIGLVFCYLGYVYCF